MGARRLLAVRAVACASHRSTRQRRRRLRSSKHRFLSVIFPAAPAAVVAVAALGMAPVARADPASICSPPVSADCRRDVPGYLSMLASAGINGNSDQTLVTVGDHVCADLAHGTPSVVVADGLRQTNPSLQLIQSNVAVDAALMNLCPRLLRIDNQEPVLLPMQ